MEIVFVRHGQPEWVSGGVNVNDPPLTELGRRQAGLLAERLRRDRKGFTEVLASPTRRTTQTAAPLAEALGMDPEPVPWLEEIRMPADWEGAPEEQIERVFREARARPPEQWWEGMPGGESFSAFHERVTAGLEKTLAERDAVRFPGGPAHLWHVHRPGQRILVVGHNGSNTVALGHLLGLQPVPWEWERFIFRHTALARIVATELAGGRVWSLRSFSDVEHVPEGERTR